MSMIRDGLMFFPITRTFSFVPWGQVKSSERGWHLLSPPGRREEGM